MHHETKQVCKSTLLHLIGCPVVSHLNANYHFGKDRNEVDTILLKDGKIVPIEVKLSVDDSDLRKFSRLLEYLKVEKETIVTLSQKEKTNNIDIIQAYLLEKFF